MGFHCGCGRWPWRCPLVRRRCSRGCCGNRATGMRICSRVEWWRPWTRRQRSTSTSRTPWLHIPPETTWCSGMFPLLFLSSSSSSPPVPNTRLVRISALIHVLFLNEPFSALSTRTWVTDLPKGACALVCTSVDHEGAPVVGIRANVLTSRYFIEPSGTNKSRLTHISRIDCRLVEESQQ